MSKARAAPLAAALAVAAIFASAAGLYHHAWGSLDGFVKTIDHGDVIFSDYRTHWDPAGRTLFATGGVPVPGYFYSAFFAVVLAALAHWPPASALHAWGALQIGAAALLLIHPAYHFYRRGIGLGTFYVAAFAFSLPILNNFKWGQLSVPLTALILLACWPAAPPRARMAPMAPIAAWRDRWTARARGAGRAVAGRWLGPVALAIAASIKYYPALFALPYFLHWHQPPERRAGRQRGVLWDAALCFTVLTLGLLVVVPFVALGPRQTLRFHAAVANHARAAEFLWVSSDPNTQYLPHVVARLAPATASWPDSALPTAGALLAAINVLTVWHLHRRAAAAGAPPGGERCRDLGPGDPALTFALLFVSLPYLLATSWPHYFAFLPFCQTVAACGLAGRGRGRRPAGRALTALFILASLILSTTPLFIAMKNWQQYGRYGLLLWSNLAVNAALLLDGAWLSRAPSGIRSQIEQIQD